MTFIHPHGLTLSGDFTPDSPKSHDAESLAGEFNARNRSGLDWT
jgi:hypothetical protein